MSAITKAEAGSVANLAILSLDLESFFRFPSDKSSDFLNFGWWFMLSQVAKLFLFRNWFVIIDLWSVSLLETSWQLV